MKKLRNKSSGSERVNLRIIGVEHVKIVFYVNEW